MAEPSAEPRRLRRPMFAPPGGVWFTRITGYLLESRQSLDDLVSQVSRYYLNNSKPVPADLRSLVEEDLCKSMPPGVCTGNEGRPYYEVLPSFFEVVKAMEEFFRGHQGERCTLVQAEDRIRACIPCSRHGSHLCTSCDGLRAQARAFVKDRKTPLDGRAGVCLVYRVPVNGLVHVKDPGELPGLPDNCWVKHG